MELRHPHKKHQRYDQCGGQPCTLHVDVSHQGVQMSNDQLRSYHQSVQLTQNGFRDISLLQYKHIHVVLLPLHTLVPGRMVVVDGKGDNGSL